LPGYEPKAAVPVEPAVRAMACLAVDRGGSYHVSRRLESITLDDLDDLPRRCRRCVFWELDPVGQAQALEIGDPAFEKEVWVSSVLLQWGACGKIVYADGAPVGHLLYAPSAYVPRSLTFPTSPVSADAVLLITAFVRAEYAGSGVGRMLVQDLARDLTGRGVKAVEAFGDLKWSEPACLVPAEFLLAVGFKTVRPDPRYPRLRLELRTALCWREDVEAALDQLLDSMQPDEALRPA
jgi:GNAT superfamily N-acetyltransferase